MTARYSQPSRVQINAAAGLLMRAVEKVCADGIMTPDVGGTATTQDVTDGVCEVIRGENI
ncbi:hypothetical protein LGQ03_12595 [Loktanella sp. TSTF-M6]|uniref:Isocitrate/isopropylmalate dehydrogenase n=1 Tax=Loktanella gaetbuli TaxID=2881335 RepID=A0ABS8BWF2_9RHOB|nr:hypothetical protein [Loktanella gaetbuli]MCB5200080.1 hypothetical protein [Loktanella gaetbuli]